MAVRADNYWLSAAERAVPVTTSDSAVLNPTTRSIYVGGTGDIKVTLTGQKDSQAVTFKAVPVGTTLPVQASKIWATGTTATLLIALY